MYLAWTTVSTSEEAAKLAQGAVEASLAACVQIDGPVTSHFIWDGKAECASEFRLCFKCTMAQLPALEEHVLAQHPYEIPEWIVVRAERVGEKYLSWAQANSSTPPL
jgi:periplasmic divalent cation tolerance protein